ncbi:Outer membrane efflux protein [Thalassoglobus neptunius]|uniref:Outer membrane efflux protein n=1 Tax=Thalassoglobus neptunius TaxID=1938619 RepID=A0A5C5X186_9PLAN|nr:TolC family protein [Thalassoglobus neptunius]TWT56904.1 Outer membrane efflux protein [Thalassoglobus neptunius]
MRAHFPTYSLMLLVVVSLIGGCATTRSQSQRTPLFVSHSNGVEEAQAGSPSVEASPAVQQVAHEDDDEVVEEAPHLMEAGGEQLPAVDTISPLPSPEESELGFLVSTAVDQNPRLIRLFHEYQVAAARSQYIDKLPDPKLGANIFGDPIETAAGSQRATMSLSQTIPWLGKLNAQQQQACFEAFAVRAEYAAERLRVIAGVRVGWYRLYVIDKQIETTEANQELLESLIDVANARIATGQASQGDVLLGTLELSKLEERLLTYRKQRRAVEAEVNRLVGRSAEFPIRSDRELQLATIDLDEKAIHQIALGTQPEIQAARLRTQATRWGIEVARLSRRPELMLTASHFFTDDNRPDSSVVNVGEDPWAVGVQVSLPIWREKYDAIKNEAGWKHQAAHASVTDLADRYDALILDLMTEAHRAMETAELYADTILPQARQTLSADQESYSNGNVDFDRIIRDYRNLLTLELGYHQAVGELAIANARLQQAAGRDLTIAPVVNKLPSLEQLD